MLINRITTSDLKLVDGSIDKYLAKEQPDWQPQINEAFKVVKDKIRARGYDTRKLGVPLDLLRDPQSTALQNILTAQTRTTSGQNRHASGLDGFDRWCLDVTAMTATAGSVTVDLQGSNDNSVATSTDSTTMNWVTVETFIPTGVKEFSITVRSEFKYYRTKVTMSGGSITYTSSMVETYIDRWTIWQALDLIYKSISKSPDDGWERKSDQAAIHFQLAFDSYKFTVDTDSDNLIDSDNDVLTSATKIIQMTR
jgi:hypothetical protein